MKKGCANYKWKFAIGTTSRVPNSKQQHYLIADFDKVPHLPRIMALGANNMMLQRTPNGWHLYTDLQYSFKKLCEVLSIIGADKKWISIGKSRGYLFLADKQAVYLPWPVERMNIYAKKERQGNTA